MANRQEGQAFFYEIGVCFAFAAAIVRHLQSDDKNNITIHHRILSQSMTDCLLHEFKERGKNKCCIFCAEFLFVFMSSKIEDLFFHILNH